MPLRFAVDETLCTRCDACVRDCPRQIIRRAVDDAVPTIDPEKEADCLECQHCLAVCPTGAVSIFGLHAKNSRPLAPESLPSFQQMDLLIRGRRSVRQYRPENVDRQRIDKILSAVAHSPTGCNNRQLTFTLIDDRAVMDRFRGRVAKTIESAGKRGDIPEHASFLADAAHAYLQDGVDDFFRGAPHVLIVSARADAPCMAEDVTIALSYFELLAQAEGLGTVWCGYLKFAFLVAPELMDEVGIPRDHHCYPIVFGVPAVRYARTIQREDGAQIRRVSLS